MHMGVDKLRSHLCFASDWPKLGNRLEVCFERLVEDPLHFQALINQRSVPTENGFFPLDAGCNAQIMGWNYLTSCYNGRWRLVYTVMGLSVSLRLPLDQ